MKLTPYFRTAVYGIAAVGALNMYNDIVQDKKLVPVTKASGVSVETTSEGDHSLVTVKDGQTVRLEMWLSNETGKADREDGPALIYRNKEGKVENRVWMLQGVEMRPS